MTYRPLDKDFAAHPLLAGGEAAARVRAHDWSRTPLGPISSWPISLRTTVSVVLGSRIPMCIWWGADLRQLYNDVFASIANGRCAEPGAPAREVWSEVWDVLGPRADAMMNGSGSAVADPLSVAIVRQNGAPPAFLAFSYSAIPDDSGSVGGILVTLSDERRNVRAVGTDRRRRDASHSSLASSEVLVAVADSKSRGYVEGNLSDHGATVRGVADGDSALAEARGRVPDLVIAEAGLPADGEDLLTAIRSDARLSELPVILIPSSIGAPIGEHGDGVGADDYLTDPLNDRELVVRAEAALQLARIRHESALAVRRSEEQLRLVMDSIPAVITYTDREQRLRYFNEKLCEWSGLERGAIQDLHLIDIVGERAYEMILPRVEQALTGQLVSYEAELPYLYGGRRAVEVNYVPDVGPSGDVEGYVTLVHDVSDRKRAQHQLTDLRDQLSNELEGMILLHNVGTSLLQEGDMNSLLGRAAAAAMAITGADMADILLIDEASGEMAFGSQQGFGDDYTPFFEAVRAAARDWDEPLRHGERVIVGDLAAEGALTSGTELETVLRARGICALHSTPLNTRDGRLLGMFTTYHRHPCFPTDRDQRLLDLLARQAADLIERQLGEAALRASERRYAHLVESLPIGVYTCDLDGRITMYNEAAVRMWGREPTEDDRYCAWDRQYYPDGRPMPPEGCPMAVAIRERCAVQDEEILVERPDGARRHMLPHPVPIEDEFGKVVGAVNMVVDITERKQAEKTRALLAAIVASSGDGIISMALDGTITSWNAGAERLLGYSGQEAIGRNVSMLMPPGTLPKTESILERVRQGERVENLETVRLAKSGKRVEVSLTVSPVCDESGSIIGASKISRDISARKRSEAEIRRLNEDLEARVSELQTLLEVAPVGVFIGQDPQCDVISMNRAGAAMLRMPWPSSNASLTNPDADEIPWRIFRNGQEVAADDLPLQRCARTGEEVAGDLFEFVFDDGSVLHAKLSVSPLRDADGSLRGCVATMVDLTEQIQSDYALKTLNARLRSDVDDMVRLHEVSTQLMREQDLVVLLEAILDSAMAVCDAEMGTTQLLDQETDELRLVVWRGFGDRFVDYFETVSTADPSVCGQAMNANRRVVVGDVEENEDIRGSETIDVYREAGVRSVQSTPLVSRSGRLLGMFSTHWPVPHEPEQRELRMLDLLARQAADAIERSHSDTVLRHLNATLEDRVRVRTVELENQRLQLRRLAAELTTTEQRERRRLAALLHDDLQQLLVSAKMTIGGVSRANKVSEMMDACSRTDKLIQESIDAARDMSRQLRPPVLYEDGLLPALEWLALDMEKKHGLVTTVDTDDAVEADDHDLRALMFESARELLFNVVKYAGVKEAAIEAVSPDENLLQLSVSDPGHGFQLSALAGGTGNEGFGLFSIRERLAAIGGNMKIETGLGEGTTVTLEAPLYVEERLEMKYPQPEPGHRSLARRSNGGTGRETRVLVVDDHIVVRQGIATLIDEIPDFLVVGEASDGIEAIELMAEHQPDVVLMDVNMPRMNGIEATRHIRREWPDVLIVGLSVQEDDATAKSVLEAGAQRFMSKASSADEIMSLMREVLARK